MDFKIQGVPFLHFKFAGLDSPSDKYHRIFLCKLMLTCSLVSCVFWYNNMSCTVLREKRDDNDFKRIQEYASHACWINGVYLYKQLQENKTSIGYYGIPMDLQHDGSMTSDSKTLTTCSTKHQSDCEKMEKVFYLQFQWLPFYIAILAFWFYFPYLLFRHANDDLVTLFQGVSSKQLTSEDIRRIYFHKTMNTPKRQKLIFVKNALIKLLYLIVDVVAFKYTDTVMNGHFESYGTSWIAFNEDQRHYVGGRRFWSVTEALLPSFALCDVLELSKDLKVELTNDLKFVCEMKQHLVMHYILLVIWLAIVVGITVSCIGAISYITQCTFATYGVTGHVKWSPKSISVRQRDYLNILKREDHSLYQEVMKKLEDQNGLH